MAALALIALVRTLLTPIEALKHELISGAFFAPRVRTLLTPIEALKRRRARTERVGGLCWFEPYSRRLRH